MYAISSKGIIFLEDEIVYNYWCNKLHTTRENVDFVFKIYTTIALSLEGCETYYVISPKIVDQVKLDIKNSEIY